MKDTDGTWRIKTNNEINILIENINIITYIKAQRLGWFGHINRIQENRLFKRIYKWNQ